MGSPTEPVERPGNERPCTAFPVGHPHRTARCPT